MSTVPGDQSWRDAGLAEVTEDEPVNLVEEVNRPSRPTGEDYHPGTARPDLDDRASEGDVIDQSVAAPEEEDGSEDD